MFDKSDALNISKALIICGILFVGFGVVLSANNIQEPNCFIFGLIITLVGLALLAMLNISKIKNALMFFLSRVFLFGIFIALLCAIPIYMIFGLAWTINLGIKPNPFKFQL